MTNERLKQLLHNAISYIDNIENDYLVENVGDEIEWYGEIIDITPKELEEIGIHWLDKSMFNDTEDEEDITDNVEVNNENLL